MAASCAHRAAGIDERRERQPGCLDRRRELAAAPAADAEHDGLGAERANPAQPFGLLDAADALPAEPLREPQAHRRVAVAR